MSLGDLSQLGWVRDTRQKDIDFLKERGITHQQLHERLQAIIEKAKEAMAALPDVYNSIGVLQKKEPLVEIEGISYKVTKLVNRKVQEDACPACDHIERSPLIYVVRNVNKDLEMRTSEISLHLLCVHKMFIQVAQYRMDPERSCKVLNFVE